MAELTLVNQRAGAKRQRTDPVVVRRIKGPSGCMLEKKEVQWSRVEINHGRWVALLVNSTICRLVAVAVMTLRDS